MVPKEKSSSRRRSPVLFRVALVLLGVLVSAGASELLLRTIVFGPTTPREPVDSDAVGLPELHGVFDFLKPHLHAQSKGRLYESNSFGFRGPEMPEAKPPGVFRIAIIGDSFTNGVGVRYEEAYPALLSKTLNREGDPRRYEVLNLGIGGFNLGNNVDRLNTLGWKFSPDLVLYGYTVNDLEGKFYRPSLSPLPPTWATPSLLLNLLGNQYNHLRDEFWPAKGSYLWELDDNYFRNPAAWGTWVRDLRRLKDAARRHKVCLRVFLHTQLQMLDRWHPFRRYDDAIRGEALRREIPVIESYPYFQGRAPEPLWINAYDSHPNREGHRILAQALVDGLGVLPPECWGGQLPLALREEARSEEGQPN